MTVFREKSLEFGFLVHAEILVAVGADLSDGAKGILGLLKSRAWLARDVLQLLEDLMKSSINSSHFFWGLATSLAFLTASLIGLASLASLTSSLALFSTSFWDFAKATLLRVPFVIVELCLLTFSMILPSGDSSSFAIERRGPDKNADRDKNSRAQGENDPFPIHLADLHAGGDQSWNSAGRTGGPAGAG